MKKTVITIFAAAIAALCFVSCSKELTLRVKTEQGTLEGIEQEGVKMFLGVPFATAPVGELRWKAPQPAQKWSGVRSAKEFGGDPMQPMIYSDMIFRGSSFTEDCLYLNIWTCAERRDEGLPVLIYFNGGGLMAGSGSEPRYDGAAIAREGVIGITANYREGVFGFFSHPELSAEGSYGNFGHLDQVAAIQWVKDNIAAFGGDSDRIFIVGESAGSYSVSLLMASPLSRDLIAGAILSSGAELAMYKAKTLEQAEADGLARFAAKGIGSIAEARALSADSLQTLLPPFGMSRLVIDGYFLSEPADSVFARGEQSPVPMLAGWNSMESSPLWQLGGQKPTIANYKKMMSGVFGDMTDEIFEAYGLHTDADLDGQRGRDLAGDLFTGMCTWKACDLHSKTSGQPVYRYKFLRPRPDMDGAVHSADIEFAMGNLDLNPVYKWSDDDYAVSRTFISFYANFCKTGDPNGEGLPHWTPLDPNGPAPVMQIDVVSAEVYDPAIENGYHTLDKFFKNK